MNSSSPSTLSLSFPKGPPSRSLCLTGGYQKAPLIGGSERGDVEVLWHRATCSRSLFYPCRGFQAYVIRGCSCGLSPDSLSTSMNSTESKQVHERVYFMSRPPEP